MEGARPGQRDCLFVEVISGARDFEPLFGVAESLTAVSLVHVFEGEVNQEGSVVAARRKLLVLGEEILDQVLSPLWIHVGDPVRAVTQQAESFPQVGPVGIVTKRKLGQRLGGTSCAAEGEGEDGATNHFRFGEQERFLGVAGVEIADPLVPTHGVGVGAEVPGPLRSELRHPQLGLLVARTPQVLGHLGSRRRVVERLQCGSHAAVVGRRKPGQLLEERLGQERVPRPYSARGPHRQRGRLELSDRRNAAHLVLEGDYAEGLEGNHAPNDRQCGERLLGGRRHGADPCRQKPGQALRYPLTVRSGGDQLLGEERVALSPGEHLRSEVLDVGADGMGQGGHEAEHVVSAERPQANFLHPGGAPLTVQPLRYRLGQPALVGPAGDQQMDRRTVPRAREVRQQVQGVGIGPVHVLHHQRHRLVLAHPGQQRLARNEDLVAPHILGRLDLLRKGARHHPGEVRAKGGRQRARGTRQGATSRRIAGIECVDNPEQGKDMTHRQTAANHAQALRAGGDNLRHQPRLADPGVAHQKRDTDLRRSQMGQHLGELAVPSDHPSRHAAHRNTGSPIGQAGCDLRPLYDDRAMERRPDLQARPCGWSPS